MDPSSKRPGPVAAALRHILENPQLHTLRTALGASGRIAQRVHALVLHPLLSALTSATFLLYVLTPFAGWSIMLMGFGSQLPPDELARSVAAGPWSVVALWMLFAGGAAAFYTGFDRQRTALPILLAVIALGWIRAAAHAPPLPSMEAVPPPPWSLKH